MSYEHFDQSDIQRHKILAAVGYILFFVPLIGCPGSRVGRFCANQGLLLFIAAVAVSVVTWILSLIPFIGVLFHILQVAADIALLAIAAVCAYMLIMREEPVVLPFAGDITLIK